MSIHVQIEPFPEMRWWALKRELTAVTLIQGAFEALFSWEEVRSMLTQPGCFSKFACHF